MTTCPQWDEPAKTFWGQIAETPMKSRLHQFRRFDPSHPAGLPPKTENSAASSTRSSTNSTMAGMPDQAEAAEWTRLRGFRLPSCSIQALMGCRIMEGLSKSNHGTGSRQLPFLTHLPDLTEKILDLTSDSWFWTIVQSWEPFAADVF